MSKRSDGGPAFPSAQCWTVEGVDQNNKDVEMEVHGTNPGMSLRDKFADSAIKLFGFEKLDIMTIMKGEAVPFDRAAKACYDFADAMLKAREA